jgi:hypothetical protein
LRSNAENRISCLPSNAGARWQPKNLPMNEEHQDYSDAQTARPRKWATGRRSENSGGSRWIVSGLQRTQTQSSVRTLRSLRPQMDVWFCLMQESSAERHCCVEADPDQTNCAPSGARPGILCFFLDFDLHRRGPPFNYSRISNRSNI